MVVTVSIAVRNHDKEHDHDTDGSDSKTTAFYNRSCIGRNRRFRLRYSVTGLLAPPLA